MVIDVSEILGWTGLKAVFGDYALAVFVFILSWLILKLFQTVILRRLKKLSEATETKVDDIIISVLESLGWPFYLVISLYISFEFIILPDIIRKAFVYLVYFVVIYYFVKGIQRIIDFSVEEYTQKQRVVDKSFDPSVIEVLSSALKMFLWVLAILLFLQNQGYEVSALIAGLGVGGIAIAFALQNILTDIFAYFSIAFDKPFKLGDRILIGTDMGVVKKIGLKSTRIKTLQGEELIVSNKDITSGRLRNYKRMDARTVMFTIGIPYATPNKKVERISGFVASVIKPIDKASFERAHFRSFGETSLIFEIAYSIKSPKYADYLDVQQQINLGIKQKLEKEGIKMSAPK